ncbi:MAG: indole-3-glycerol phosphate synthase [Planctomycetota bacterium]|jgi:indole-3-glycerol phosphate synthase
MAFSDIVEETHQRVAQDKQKFPFELIRNETLFPTQADNFEAAFKSNQTNIITEIKYGSPSRGKIFDPAIISPNEVASAYVSNGAIALSILTEPNYFHGSYDYITSVRRAHPNIPIIMKDFYLDPYQIYLARYLGASIALLVVRYLDEEQLKDFYAITLELGLSALVEVHDVAELEIASKIGCKVMGVNNRNLQTMAIDLAVGKDLAPHFPADIIKVCESGIFERAEIDEFSALGYDGFLIGTSLMMDGRPGEALNELVRP